MGTFTKGTKYVFLNSGSATKCVTYNNFYPVPSCVLVYFWIYCSNTNVEVDTGYNNYVGIGPYGCGRTPYQLQSSYGVYNSNSMFLDVWCDDGYHMTSFTGWNMYNTTSAITGYSTIKTVASGSGRYHFASYVFSGYPNTSKTFTLNLLMYDGDGYSNYESGETLGYSPYAGSKITYKFDSPKININIDSSCFVTASNSYCSSTPDVYSDNKIIVNANGSTYRDYSVNYYLNNLMYSTSRSTGTSDGSSGSTCTYDSSSCIAHYCDSGSDEYSSGY